MVVIGWMSVYMQFVCSNLCLTVFKLYIPLLREGLECG